MHFHLVLPSSQHKKASHLSAIFQHAKIDIARYGFCTTVSMAPQKALLLEGCISYVWSPLALYRIRADQIIFYFFCMISESFDMKELEQHISYRKRSKARPDLKSPYNFMPFLLPRYFKDVGRIIYLDADIVVKVRHNSCILIYCTYEIEHFQV